MFYPKDFGLWILRSQRWFRALVFKTLILILVLVFFIIISFFIGFMVLVMNPKATMKVFFGFLLLSIHNFSHRAYRGK